MARVRQTRAIRRSICSTLEDLLPHLLEEARHVLGLVRRLVADLLRGLHRHVLTVLELVADFLSALHGLVLAVLELVTNFLGALYGLVLHVFGLVADLVRGLLDLVLRPNGRVGAGHEKPGARSAEKRDRQHARSDKPILNSFHNRRPSLWSSPIGPTGHAR